MKMPHTVRQAAVLFAVGLVLALFWGIFITDLKWVIKTLSEFGWSIVCFILSGIIFVRYLPVFLLQKFSPIVSGILTAYLTFALSLTSTCLLNSWIYSRSPSSDFYSFAIGPFFWIGTFGSLPAVVLGIVLGWWWKHDLHRDRSI